MGKEERLKLIKELEELRDSKIITYVVGERPGLAFRISGDVPRLLYRHLRKIKRAKRIDLFLYSIGGDSSVPWRIVSTIREFCDEFNVIVPFKAYSATTMIALGADNIILGKKAELGPIDPALTTPFNPRDPTGKLLEIGVESVMGYFSLLQDKLEIKDPEKILSVFLKLSDKVDPLALGEISRQHSYIRMVAEKLLKARKDRIDEKTIKKVIESLVKESYFHGHSINRREAKELGLPIVEPDEKIEEKLWELYREYEKELKLMDVFDPREIIDKENTDNYILKDMKAVYLESLSRTDICKVDVHISRKRQYPQNLNINLNMQLPPIPSNLDPQKLQETLQQLQIEIQKQVHKNIEAQAPVIGIDIETRGGWVEE